MAEANSYKLLQKAVKKKMQIISQQPWRIPEDRRWLGKAALGASIKPRPVKMEKDERLSADINSTRKNACMGGYWREREREKKSDVMINNFLARRRLSLTSLMAHAADVLFPSGNYTSLSKAVNNTSCFQPIETLAGDPLQQGPQRKGLPLAHTATRE